MIFFFFFQAEDGIRDLTVTGVQTCALPILDDSIFARSCACRLVILRPIRARSILMAVQACPSSSWISRAIEARSSSRRSGERRVGEEGRSRWAPDHLKKKKESNQE